MPKIKELKEKIAKMENGLSNEHIAEPQKVILRKAIENAKSQLAELEKEPEPKPVKKAKEVIKKEVEKPAPKTPEHQAEIDFLISFFNDEDFTKKAVAKIKEHRFKMFDENDFTGQEISRVSMLFLLIVDSSFGKDLNKLFSVDAKIIQKIASFSVYGKDYQQAQKLVENTILANFTTPSQFAAMKSSELDDVRHRAFLQIMNTPLSGTTEQDKFHLHYFNSGSDVYLSDVDYGTNLQDFGYAVLNGDLQNAEYGYISIKALLKNGFELDLYFTPINKKVLLDKLHGRTEEPKPSELKFNFTEGEMWKEIDKDVVFTITKIDETHVDSDDLNPKLSTVISEKKADFADKMAEGLYEVVEIVKDDEIEDFSITEKRVNELVTIATAQVFLEHGLNIEIVSIKEVVSDGLLDVHFELIREIDGMRDRAESTSLSITENGEIEGEFVFPIPKNFDCEKFIASLLDDVDKRTKNQIYSYSTFLRDHSEELVGEKVASKTVKNLSAEKQEKLKTEYKQKVTTKKGKPEATKPTGKVKLTKRLIAHGVTQEMVNEVNKTKEGVSIAIGRQAQGKNSKHDRQKRAMLPGKRLSATGKIYYEYRKDRTDKDPDKRI